MVLPLAQNHDNEYTLKKKQQQQKTHWSCFTYTSSCKSTAIKNIQVESDGIYWSNQLTNILNIFDFIFN